MNQDYFINAFFAIIIGYNDSKELINIAKKDVNNSQIKWYPAKKLHLTIAYCKHINTHKIHQLKNKKYLTNFTTEITLTKISILNNQIVFLIKNNQNLNLTRQMLINDLKKHNISYDHKFFIPHITIAYPSHSIHDLNIQLSKTIQINSIELFQSKNNNYIKV